MSLWLSTTRLVPPTVPTWLEELCQRLSENDENLTTVELTQNVRMDDMLAKVLAESMEDNVTVRSLVLSFFSIVDDGAYAIGSVLAKSKVLQKLQLRELRNSREVITIFRLLRENSSIEELSLRHSQICPMGAEAVGDFFKHHGNLQEVRFVDCQFTGNSLELLCNGLAETRSPLQRLYLVNTDIGSERVIHLAKLLQKKNSSLRELFLGENELGDEGVALLTAGVLESTSLRLLDLRSNGITSTGAMSLQGIITRSPFVLTLNLGNNILGNQGAAALARGLAQSSCVLQTLDLSDNAIEEAGASALASMLRYNVSLEDLNLSFNAIGDDGAHSLAAALKRNTTLRCLKLRRSALTNKGARNFAENLPRMRGLKELTLNKNSIDTAGLSALLDALRANVELEYLQVAEKVSEPVSRQIVHWIRLNKAGRRIFRHANVHQHLWPLLYGRVSGESELLFHFLREKPEALST
jgi:Ran GTPase-activating protein (RanGAP) involved in mRNA processing and transport